MVAFGAVLCFHAFTDTKLCSVRSSLYHFVDTRLCLFFNPGSSSREEADFKVGFPTLGLLGLGFSVNPNSDLVLAVPDCAANWWACSEPPAHLRDVPEGQCQTRISILEFVQQQRLSPIEAAEIRMTAAENLQGSLSIHVAVGPSNLVLAASMGVAVPSVTGETFLNTLEPPFYVEFQMSKP